MDLPEDARWREWTGRVEAVIFASPHVTTKKFLEVFGLAALRDLPDIERLEDEGLLETPKPEADLDAILFPGGEDFDAGDHWD